MNVFNPFSLEGKTILVVGASSGIGREIALECSMMGAKVIVSARNEDRLKEVVAECGGESLLITTDITNSDEVNRLVKTMPNIDGLVITSGITTLLPVQFCTRSKFDEVFNVNFFAYTELVRLLYKNKKINKGGAIVLLSSLAAFGVSPGNTIYAASKAALNHFMRYAALEFSARNVRVNTINPGMVNTPMTANLVITKEELEKDMKNYPLGRYGEPEDIAPLAIYLLSDASSWMTGQAIIIDGGCGL